MREIYFATTNKGKVNSVNNILSKHNIEVIHYNIELPEPRSDDLQTITKEKVLFAYDKIKKPCFAIDVGFYIHSLNGFPKAFVNFTLETIGLDGLLKLTENKQRECEFRNCLAYLDNTLMEPVYFESTIKGVLAESIKGKQKDYQWSELWQIFVPERENKTIAEMGFEEYQVWREKIYGKSYLQTFADWLNSR